VVAAAGLAGPGATWLQCRDRWLAAGEETDAVYLVAGERDQDRRVAAIEALPWQPALILIGNDRQESIWSREEQRNLTVAEWAVKKIGERVACRVSNVGGGAAQREGAGHSAPPNASPTPGSNDIARRPAPDTRHPTRSTRTPNTSLQIVPGVFNGTDGEMEALAEYLELDTGIRSVALVTSPFHIRRVLDRFGVYSDREIEVRVVSAAAAWKDRAPWIVLGEMLKMARDRMGLSRTPGLSRGGWLMEGERESEQKATKETKKERGAFW